MRLLVVLMLLATVMPVMAAPTALAHACSGTQANCVCPVPNDGATHSHAGPSGSCTNGASATPGGAEAPGPTVPLVLLGLAALALVVGRRR